MKWVQQMNDSFAKKLNEIAAKIRANRGEVKGEESTTLAIAIARFSMYDLTKTK